jgi:hypothetical protein
VPNFTLSSAKPGSAKPTHPAKAASIANRIRKVPPLWLAAPVQRDQKPLEPGSPSS